MSTVRRRWQDYRLPVIAVTLLIGLIIGWGLGTWSTCGAKCSFNVTLFDAWGTWVGGVALAAASLIFTTSQAMATKRQIRAQAMSTAILCKLHTRPSLSDGRLGKVVFSFDNKTPLPVQHVSAHLEGGSTFREDLHVEPGRTWGFRVPPGELGLPLNEVTEDEARQLVRTVVRPKLVFVFTINGHRFVRRGGQVYSFETAPEWRTASNA